MQDAAHELGVTPGAISQRIRAVEERHGLRLFTRSKNGIALTVAGLALKSNVSAAFAEIESAHQKHFANRLGAIRMSAPASFAHSMLVSSLGRFSDLYPAIKVSVETEDRMVDLKSEPVDLAIRHGLALLNDVYVKESLASGQLVRASDTAWPTAFAYYAVGLGEVLERPAVSALVEWLKKDLG